MAQLNFGGVTENVMTREEFPLEKAREVLKDETIAVIGYGVQGPGQACNLRDNGFNVIVGQRPGKTYEKAIADGWVPGETLFGIEEACEKGTIIMCLLSDAAVMSVCYISRGCEWVGCSQHNRRHVFPKLSLFQCSQTNRKIPVLIRKACVTIGL